MPNSLRVEHRERVIVNGRDVGVIGDADAGVVRVSTASSLCPRSFKAGVDVGWRMAGLMRGAKLGPVAGVIGEGGAVTLYPQPTGE